MDQYEGLSNVLICKLLLLTRRLPLYYDRMGEQELKTRKQ